MIGLSVLAYVADGLILAAYASGRHRWFDTANAVGGPPLLAVEVATQAWPIIPITATFFVIGLWRTTRRLRP